MRPKSPRGDGHGVGATEEGVTASEATVSSAIFAESPEEPSHVAAWQQVQWIGGPWGKIL